MAFTLPNLPYDHGALAPHISAETLKIHHGRHHAAYVNNTNDLVRGTDFATKSLEDIVRETAGVAAHRGLFNNAAQAWNHDFYWRSMRPQGGGKPSGALARRIDTDFGKYEAFAEKFAAAAKGQFGSGWAWLVLDGDRLKITQTSNGNTPIAHGQTPLLTIDVWEHAYYLDFQNRRPDYVTAFITHLVNWDFANANLASAPARPRAAVPAA